MRDGRQGAPAGSAALRRVWVIWVAAVALLLAGCSFGPTPEPTPFVPEQPEAMAAEEARSLDVCALLPEDVLQKVLAPDGPGRVRRAIFSEVSGCAVFAPEAGADSRQPAYVISLLSWPNATDWPVVMGGGRSSKVLGGWFVVGAPVDGPQRASGYSERGAVFEITAVRPGPSDVEREKAIMTTLLSTMARGSLPTIPWKAGSLLSQDICSAAEKSALSIALDLIGGGGGGGGLIAPASPDGRDCLEKTAASGIPPGFRVSSGFIEDIPRRAGSVLLTVAGHQAVRTATERNCRVTVVYPPDPVLARRLAAPRTPALFLEARSTCDSATRAMAVLVDELDRKQ